MEVSRHGLKQRILYVITKGSWGGAQRYVYDLARAAAEAGHDVAVAYGEPGELSERLSTANIRTIEVPSLIRDVKLGGDLAAFRALTSLFRIEAPSVVHLNSSKAGAIGALAARSARVPRIIFTAHGWAFNEQRPLWQRLVFAGIHAMTVLLSNVTICVSEAIRTDMKWLPFANRKLVVVRNGITCPTFLEQRVARTKLLPEHMQKFWIGMVSELHPTKRIADAIEAFSQVAETNPAAILVILGGGEERERLESLIRARHLESRVFLLGFIPDARTYLKAFDLFLHTSRSEALAYAILEAGCAALPTIATKVGGIPEIITTKEHGLLVPREQPHDIAAALTTLLSDPETSTAYGRALHVRVTERFSQAQMVERTLRTYDA